MVNRLTQFLLATSQPNTAPPVPQPTPIKRGDGHYVVTVYRPRHACPEGWKPRDIDDETLVPIQRKECKTKSRHRTLLSAIIEARNLNVQNLESLNRWHGVNWRPSGDPAYTHMFMPSITPLRFWSHMIEVPKWWQPKSLLDMPAQDLFIQSMPGCQYDTLDELTIKTAERNRERFEMVKKEKFWHVAVAAEREPIAESMFLHSFGDDRAAGRGTFASQTFSRFHIINPSWPLCAEVRALLEGGDA